MFLPCVCLICPIGDPYLYVDNGSRHVNPHTLKTGFQPGPTGAVQETPEKFRP